MIIDSFLFCREYDMLEFRLRLLYDHVDKFVIVEGDKTFSGLHKGFNFDKMHLRYAWAEDKIVYSKLICDTDELNLYDKPKEFNPSHDCWQIEYAQRNAIVNACSSFADDDLLIMGDVDEIPSIEAIEWAKQNVRKFPVVCQQNFFYYNLKHLRVEPWQGSIFTTLRMAREVGTQALRNHRNSLPMISDGGWHLSWFTDVEGIQRKIHSFSHLEYCTDEFLDEDHIKQCLETNDDLFKRGTKHIEVPITFFPEYFREKAKGLLIPNGIA